MLTVTAKTAAIVYGPDKRIMSVSLDDRQLIADEYHVEAREEPQTPSRELNLGPFDPTSPYAPPRLRMDVQLRIGTWRLRIVVYPEVLEISELSLPAGVAAI